MRTPTREDLAALQGRTAQWFTDWLKTGLNEYLFEEKGRAAFPGAEDFIDQPEGDIATDLRLVASALDDRDLEAFRQAIAALLRWLDFGARRDVVIATFLVNLGARLKARGLTDILAEKAFSIGSREGTRLYDIAFDLADKLAAIERDSTVRCLHHLIRQEHLFQPTATGRALIALAKADAAAFPKHYDRLRSQLEGQYGRLTSEAGEQDRRPRRRRLIAALNVIVPDRKLLAYPLIPDHRPAERNWWLASLAEDFPDLLKELALVSPWVVEPPPQRAEPARALRPIEFDTMPVRDRRGFELAQGVWALGDFEQGEYEVDEEEDEEEAVAA